MSNKIRFNLSETDLRKLGVSEINIKDLKKISNIKTLNIIEDVYESIDNFIDLVGICEEIYLMWGAHRNLSNIDKTVSIALKAGYKLKKFNLSGEILEKILRDLALHVNEELVDIREYIGENK